MQKKVVNSKKKSGKAYRSIKISRLKAKHRKLLKAQNRKR